MRLISIVAVSLINLLIALRYCWLTRRQKIRPALAMWTFFSIAVGISLITYLADQDYSPLDNILNTTDLGLVLSITITIAVFGDKSTKFNRFDLGCLLAVLTILVFWIFTKNHFLTHLAVQAIMTIAYFPVVKRLWKSRENTESFLPWIGMLLAPLLSLLSSQGVLAAIYSLRAIVSVSLLLLLMLRIELKKTRKK